MKRCNNCGTLADDRAGFCPKCGAPMGAPYVQQSEQQNPQQGYNPYNNAYNNGYNNVPDSNNAFDSGASGKSRGVCALLAILLGGLGIQYFYVGKTTAGILCIILTIVTCGLWEIVTLIQGIIMLASMTNRQFEDKYVYSNSTFPIF